MGCANDRTENATTNTVEYKKFLIYKTTTKVKTMEKKPKMKLTKYNQSRIRLELTNLHSALRRIEYLFNDVERRIDRLESIDWCMDRWIENLDHTLASAMEINFASNVETLPKILTKTGICRYT